MNRSKSHSGFLRSGGSIFQGKQASSEFGGLPGCSPPMAMICARHRLFRGLIAQFNQQNLLDMIQRDGQPAKGRRNSAICCLGSDLMRCAVLLPKTMGVPPLKVEDLEDLGSLADYLTIPWGLSETPVTWDLHRGSSTDQNPTSFANKTMQLGEPTWNGTGGSHGFSGPAGGCWD